MAFALKKLTPNIMVEDVSRTIRFYQDVLGFQLLAKVPEEGVLDWAMLKRDDVELMVQSRLSLGSEIAPMLDKAISASLTFYIVTEDVKGLREQLEGKVTIVQEMHKTFYNTNEFAIEDVNGYVWAFAEDIK